MERSKPYLTPEEAALQLGMCPREIRIKMRRGEIDLGMVIPPSPGKTKWKFYIYQPKIDKITGGGTPQ